MQTLKERRDYQREWYRRNKSASAKRNGHKTNGHAKQSDLVEVIKAYQTLHQATNDGEVKSQLSKALVQIVSKN